jgi:hypothetical protein
MVKEAPNVLVLSLSLPSDIHPFVPGAVRERFKKKTQVRRSNWQWPKSLTAN